MGRVFSGFVNQKKKVKTDHRYYDFYSNEWIEGYTLNNWKWHRFYHKCITDQTNITLQDT